MSIGLIALLDEIAALAKVAAASLDDVAGQIAKAGTKAAGVVIDDAAVVPRYAAGFAAARELPIIFKIALGSVRNKLLILLPAALILSLLAPWAITPLLVLGGGYLCYEGAEKVLEVIFPPIPYVHQTQKQIQSDPQALEDRQVASAIKTDFILSAEIMAITLASVADTSWLMRALVLAAVGTGVTAAVYLTVALIVKADDLGVALAGVPSRSALGSTTRMVGRIVVRCMPLILKCLSIVGTAAMLWVGGNILGHGLVEVGAPFLSDSIHHLAVLSAQTLASAPEVAGWTITAMSWGLFGLTAGAALVALASLAVAPGVRFLKTLRR